MAYSASRLTLFALLSAIETDLRTLVTTRLSETTSDVVIPDQVLATALERRTADLGASEDPTLEEILPYVDLPDLYQVLNRNRNRLPSDLGQHLRAVTPDLERLVPIRNRIAHTRPLNFDDLAIALNVAEDLSRAEKSVWVELRETLKRLGDDPSFVLALQPTTDPARASEHHNLPAPDFDDTGFVGRRNQVKEVVRLCQGPWPVISIIGDGGLGKTALALKVAYDVLDLQPCPFDAVVWTTSKTMQLTPTEIVRIEGAIQDSLGMMQDVASYLGGTDDTPMEEVLAYLEEFRILLILDNLETVLDDRIRAFLSRLPTGSKIVMTSRIGLGAFEHPVQLEPLRTDEAVHLLRAVARVRGVTLLSKAPAKQLEGYVARMNSNPGFIKWFVSVVQAGRAPEDALANPALFLEFCMSNVYEYLGGQSRLVLDALVAIPGSHSSSEVAVLTEMEPTDLQRALQQLLTTNMVVMSSISTGATYQTQYDVSDFARSYLAQRHPVSADLGDTLHRRWRDLVRSGEQMRSGNPYSIGTIAIRNRGDIPVVRLLTEALERARQHDFATANERILAAKALAPEYSEVHRVEALVRHTENNYPAAHAAYEAAVELDPTSATTRFWYAGFLMRSEHSVEDAIAQLQEAHRLDPDTPIIRMEMARAYLWARQYDHAHAQLEALKPMLPQMSEWSRRKTHDLQIQIHGRQGNDLVREKEYYVALSRLLSAREAFEACPPYLRDAQIRVSLGRCIGPARQCAAGLDDPELRQLAEHLVRWLNQESSAAVPNIEELPVGFRRGWIARLVRERGFGFIRADDGRELFFHMSDLNQRLTWETLAEEAEVMFRVGSGDKGEFAIQVSTIAKST